MPKSHRPYPPEFRQQMVELVRAGRPPEELSQEFEPSSQAIRNWVRQADRDEGRRADGVSSAEREELRRLRRENKRLRTEREILSKAATWFARGGRFEVAEVFGFVSAHQDQFPIATMCRVLGVSPSGYYAWRRREPSARSVSDAQLTALIGQVHTWSRGTYGVPRMVRELRARGPHVNPKRVARLMREAGWQGVSRRQSARTTRRDRDAPATPDLVDRDFTASGPDALWVADITYVPTGSGFLYLAVVLDAWSRRVVGWAMASHLRAELVVQALDMALGQRRPEGVIHHSDQGCQYSSLAFGRRCREAGVRPSTGLGRRLLRQRAV